MGRARILTDDVLQLANDLRSAGMSFDKIVVELEARGTVTRRGKKISATGLRSALERWGFVLPGEDTRHLASAREGSAALLERLQACGGNRAVVAATLPDSGGGLSQQVLLAGQNRSPAG